MKWQDKTTSKRTKVYDDLCQILREMWQQTKGDRKRVQGERSGVRGAPRKKWRQKKGKLMEDEQRKTITFLGKERDFFIILNFP